MTNYCRLQWQRRTHDRPDLSSEGAPQKKLQDCNFQKKNLLSKVPYLGSTPRHTDWLTVNRNATLTLSISQLTVIRLSRQCGILNISQPFRPPRSATGIAFLFYFPTMNYINEFLIENLASSCVWGWNSMNTTHSVVLFCSPEKQWNKRREKRRFLLYGAVWVYCKRKFLRHLSPRPSG
jgi:hypothetical protein